MGQLQTPPRLAVASQATVLLLKRTEQVACVVFGFFSVGSFLKSWNFRVKRKH